MIVAEQQLDATGDVREALRRFDKIRTDLIRVGAKQQLYELENVIVQWQPLLISPDFMARSVDG